MRLILALAGWLSCVVAACADEYAAVRDKLQLCATCHGENGASSSPLFPVLAGQHLHYTYVQLKDFKAGRRAGAIMGPIATALEKEEMLAIAKYFSEQPWPSTGYETSPADKRLGLKVVNAGQCVACHLGGFEGNSRVPWTAGQHREYLAKTMRDFKTKARNNSPAKSSLLGSFSDAEIEAVANYLAGLKSSEK